jgi:hypothetical protein
VVVVVASVIGALGLLLVLEVGRRPPGAKPGDLDYRWYSRLFTAFDRWRGGT